jgi:hypothetical protein
LGFAVVLIYLAIYGITLYKKMDMPFFPHNSMFSSISTHDPSAITTFGVKINDRLIGITDNIYWKKDFLEMSLIEYSAYLKNGNRVYLDDYLASRKIDGSVKEDLQRLLTPDDIKAQNWTNWFAQFAGIGIDRGSKIEVTEYHYEFSDGKFRLRDSLALCNKLFR